MNVKYLSLRDKLELIYTQIQSEIEAVDRTMQFLDKLSEDESLEVEDNQDYNKEIALGKCLAYKRVTEIINEIME